MRIRSVFVLAVLLALSAIPPSRAVPAPDPDRRPKQTLEALQKRLPAAVGAWAKEHWYASCTVDVRLVRRFSADEAKVYVTSRNTPGVSTGTDVIILYLRYYDGAWSPTRYEARWPASDSFHHNAARLLMLAIDESNSK
jgi:hypothetical protein